MYLLAAVLPVVLIIAALVDIITRDESLVKHLPKTLWVVLVIFLPLVGSIIWFIVGRDYAPRPDRGSFGDPRRWGGAPEGGGDYHGGQHRGGQHGGGPRSGGQRSDASDRGGFAGRPARSTEDELAALEREIEFYENQDRIRKLEAEIEQRRKESE
jgi:hypothetical protein